MSSSDHEDASEKVGNPYGGGGGDQGKVKTVPFFVNAVQFGCRWEPVEGESKPDLDISAVMFDEKKNVTEKVNFSKREATNGCVLHHGDNSGVDLGADGKDDETISFFLNEIPANVKWIFCTVTVYREGMDFSEVSTCEVQVRLIPPKKQPNPCACLCSCCPGCGCLPSCGVMDCCSKVKAFFTSCLPSCPSCPSCPGCKTPNMDSLKEEFKKMFPSYKRPATGKHIGYACLCLWREGREWKLREIGEIIHGRVVRDTCDGRPDGWTRPEEDEAPHHHPDFEMPHFSEMSDPAARPADNPGDCLMWELQDMCGHQEKLRGPKGDMANT